jgi:type II secretory pathway pseudopilin PulG
MMSQLYRIRNRASGQSQDEAGFTMVEMVIGIFIFAMVIGGVVVGMSSSLNLTRQNRNRSIAANLAAQEMDTARSTEFPKLELLLGTPPPTTVLVDNVPYYVSRQTEWVVPNATSGPCQAPASASIAYLSIVVSVSWTNMAGVPPATTSTVITPPVGTYDPFTGHIGVMVRDAAGVPQENVPVSISGPGVAESQTTSVDGCAFFAFEPVGAYTVTLNKPGYVSDQLVVGPSQSATVGAGSTVSLQFQYDNAATLNATLQGTSGGAVPLNIPITLANTHLLPAGKMTFAGVNAARSLLGLFPYTDGYEMFAGNCLAADPEGMNGAVAIYPGANRPGATAVTPGGTSTATVPMHTLIVRTRTLASAVRALVPVTAKNVTDTGCPTQVTYALGTTDAAGNITVALPYGSWIIGATGTSNTVTQLLSPLVPATPTVTVSW